jgi:Uma2 family endonuclease
MGAKSGLLEAFIIARLSPWVLANRGFLLGSSAGYQCFPDTPSRVIRPDVSYVQRGRLPGDEVPEGWIALAPDLAVEVVSPNDEFSEVSEKVSEYLNVGVRLVWVVDPTRREIHVYRRDGRPEILVFADQVQNETVLPGFTCRVAELFGIYSEASA